MKNLFQDPGIMSKLVLKIDMPDDGAKRKALKIVAAFPGIDSISVNMKERKMTIIGTVDPTKVVSKLRKYWTTELLTVGPAKEPEKKEEPKKEEAKKEGGGGDKKPAADDAKKEGGDQEKKPAEAKKEGESGEGKKEGEAKTNVEAAASAGGGEKKDEEKKVDPVLEMVRAYRAYNPHMTKYYYAHSMEENPNACVIC